MEFTWLSRWQPELLAILRIVTALLFIEHGTAKLFDFPVAVEGMPQPLPPLVIAAAWIEIVAGGLIYTAGVPFYVWKSKRYTHAVWHLFVLGGVACHFAAVLSLVSGPD